MPVGLGGAIAEGLGGNLNQQIANTLAGPSPNPNPGAQGAPQGGGAPPTPAPGANLPPAQAYAPDPVNANTMALLLKVHQQDALGADLNQRIAGISASFGTAQQQHDKMSQLQALGGIPDDRLKAIQESQGIMQEQQKQTEHSQFMAGADIMGQQLLGLKPGQGSWLAQSGQLPEIVQSHLHSMEPTDAIKNYNATRAAMKAQGYDDATIDKLMPPEMLMLGPNADISQRQYTIEQIQARAAGKTDFPDFETWKEQHKQTATETEDAHKVAMQLPGLKSQLTSMDDRADAVTKDSAALQRIQASTSKKMAASQIINWDGKGQDPTVTYTSGPTASLDPDEARVVANIRQLHLANYAANFKDAGPSQRLSQSEAKRLGDAADQLSNFSGSIDDYNSRIADTKNHIAHAMANAHGEARDLDNLPVQYRAKIDPSFLDGPNAVKGRPTWAVPKAVTTDNDIAQLAYGQAYKPTTGKYAGRILFKGLESGYED